MFKYSLLFLLVLHSSNILAKDPKKQIKCLADNVYNEARGESVLGQKAVAMVTLNRVKKHNKSVCEIVYEKGQFSWTRKKLLTKIDVAVYNSILYLVQQIFYNINSIPDITKGATFYHSVSIKNPWNFRKTTRIGKHVFYEK